MSTNLNDDDISRIADRVVALIGQRLVTVPTMAEQRQPAPALPTSPALPLSVTRLAYTAKEVCTMLDFSRSTLWKLEARNLIRSVPGIRNKLYSRVELERFLAGGKQATR